MPDNAIRLRERGGETEKITINLGYVDLGRVDLLVQEGFYSNRTDFIRTAIRTQLAAHADAVTQSIVRHTLELGLRDYSKADLEAVKADGERLHIKVVGLARIASDVSAELALATIESITVLGAVAGQRGTESGPCRSHPIGRRPPNNQEMIMNEDFVAAMRRATRSTRASNVAEATRVIQDALMGRAIPARAKCHTP